MEKDLLCQQDFDRKIGGGCQWRCMGIPSKKQS